MRDIAKQELNVGDKVAFIPNGGYTYTLEVGEIIGFTAKKVRIQEMDRDFTHKIHADPCLKFPEQVVSLGVRGLSVKDV